jgi:hypothetical protein
VSAWQAQAKANVWDEVVVPSSSPLPGQSHTVTLSIQLAASGGTSALTWSLVSGALPSPCTLSSGGLISGIASAAGTSSFTVKALDTAGNQAREGLHH